MEAAAMSNPSRSRLLIRTLTASLLYTALAGCVANSPRYNPPPPYAPAHDVIAVSYASYGTRWHSCDAAGQIAAQASGRSRLHLQVGNNLCGDPHPNRSKSLEIGYYCGRHLKTASAPENSMLILSCP